MNRVQRMMFLIAVFFFSIMHVSHTVLAQETAILKAGRFWTPAFAIGDQNIPRGIAKEGWFPGIHNVFANNGYRYAVLACTNWQDPEGTAHETVICSPASELNPDGTVITPLESYIRYLLPVMEIDGENTQIMPFGKVDPLKMIGSCDQVIENIYEYALGVRAYRKIFAWSQSYHDDYYVTDVVYTNISSQTLKKLYIWQSYSPVFNGHKAYGTNPYYNAPGDPNVSWCHYYGSRPGDSLRIYYNYHADDPDVAGDNMGQPVPSQGGRLMRADAGFQAFLHVSEAPYIDPLADQNDFLQPRVTYFGQSVKMGHYNPNGIFGYDIDHPRAKGYDFFAGRFADRYPTPGQFENTHHQSNTDEINDPDYTAQGNHMEDGRFLIHGMFSCGPYDMKPGESIRIVFVQGTAGLGVERSINIGKQWKDGTIEYPEGLPDTTTGFLPGPFAFPYDMTDRDHKKNLWISTVIDSVHKTVWRAKWNFEHKWQVPAAPVPPEQHIKGQAGYVEIKWSEPELETDDNFAGYRIIRRTSLQDTVLFEQIHRTSADKKATEHTYLDEDIEPDKSYYYMVQSAIRVDENNFNAVPEARGKILWSNPLFTPSTKSVVPGEKIVQYGSDIRIVPNPYHIHDPKVREMGWVDHRGIVFYNLPETCTIRIFTEDGDLLRTLEFTGSDLIRNRHWDMTVENGLVIQSGMYIAVFEDAAGQVSYQKFMVVR